MPKLTGFGVLEKIRLKSAISDGKYCINKALKEAFDKNDAFQARLGTYFGGGSGGAEASSHLVMKTINSMKIMIDSDMYVVKRGGDKNGTNAEMENFPQREVGFKGTDQKKARTARWQGMTLYAGQEVNALEASMAFSQTQRELEMSIYDLFFKLPYKLKHAQSQVETFLHELSHVSAGTLDVDSPNCYGYQGVEHCKTLGKAASNAENYGMFLQSYLI
jgi:hypothetical protein